MRRRWGAWAMVLGMVAGGAWGAEGAGPLVAPLDAAACEALRDLDGNGAVALPSGQDRSGACFGLIHGHPEYFEACRGLAVDFTRPCKGDGRPQSPLFFAVRSVNEDAVRVLLARGADARKEHLLYQLRFCDHPPRSEACGRIARVLIEQGADMEDDAMFDGGPRYETPIIFHSRARNLSVVSVLLDAGADANAPGQGGCTARDEAERNKDQPMIDLLVSRGATRSVRCALGHALLAPIIEKMFENSH